MNIEQLRADFEAWCKERFGQIPLWVEEDSEYLLSSVQLRFEAYQAGRAAGISDGRTTAYNSASRMEQMREDGL